MATKLEEQGYGFPAQTSAALRADSFTHAPKNFLLNVLDGTGLTVAVQGHFYLLPIGTFAPYSRPLDGFLASLEN